MYGILPHNHFPHRTFWHDILWCHIFNYFLNEKKEKYELCFQNFLKLVIFEKKFGRGLSKKEDLTINSRENWKLKAC